MNVQVNNFNELIEQEWNYPQINNDTSKTQLLIRSTNKEISGGKLSKSDIDILSDYPDVKSVTITGLTQDTFEYFIKKYGHQLRFIEFFKNKLVEDWSILGTLPELEGIYWFINQRIFKLWDMSKNYSLKAVALNDFTRLHDLSGVEKAPALEWFDYGNAIWSTSEIDSLKPFCETKIKRIGFNGKKIRDMDISFIPDLSTLEVFNFPTNLFTTEEVAWLVAKCPNLEGYSLKPCLEIYEYDKLTEECKVSNVIIVGKRKPCIYVEGNKARIDKYVNAFNKLVEEYRLNESCHSK